MAQEPVTVELEGGVEEFGSLTACDEAELILKKFSSSIEKQRRGRKIIWVTTSYNTYDENMWNLFRSQLEKKISLFRFTWKEKFRLSYDRRSDENLNEMKITWAAAKHTSEWLWQIQKKITKKHSHSLVVFMSNQIFDANESAWAEERLLFLIFIFHDIKKTYHSVDI